MIHRFTRFVFMLLVLFVVTSCADVPLTYRFDPDTTEAEKADTREELEQWGAVVLPDYRPVESPNGFWRFTFTDNIPPHLGLPGTNFDGRTCADHAKHCPSDYQILVRRHYPDGSPVTSERRKQIMRHELGHSLGLDHVHDDETALMWSPTPDELRRGRRRTKPITHTFTESYLRECRSAGACPSVSVSLAELWRGRRRPTACDGL